MDTNKVIVDSETFEKLRTAPNGAELCDSTGETVRVAIVPGYYRELLLAWARANFDEARARQADEDYRAGRFKTTAQALEQLQQLDANGDLTT